MLIKYLSLGLDLNNKFKIHSKKPKLRQTYFVIYFSKINVFLQGVQKVCCGVVMISFEIYEQNTVKKATIEDYLANFVIIINTLRHSSQAAKKFVIVNITRLV